jgi:hypothetical protein
MEKMCDNEFTIQVLYNICCVTRTRARRSRKGSNKTESLQ